MPEVLKLSKKEQEDLRQKAIEINKLLIKKGLEPLTDSKLAHKILEKSIGYASLGESGEVILDPKD